MTVRALAAMLLLCLARSMTAMEALPPRCHVDRSARAPAMTLAAGGAARLPIVVPPHLPPGGPLDLAVNDLQHYLQEMCGARFTVTATATLPAAGIIVGTPADWPGLGLAKALPFTRTEDRQHYLLRTTSRRVLCLGAHPAGAAHAVYDLLERLGCRWYAPSPAWTIVPRRPTLTVRADVEQRPDFYMFVNGAAGAWGESDYNRRTRNAGAPMVYNNHNLSAIAVVYEKILKEEHPEYNAELPDNPKDQPRRYSWCWCLSNPGARALIAGYVLDYFRKNPAVDSFSLEPADGNSACQCAACRTRSASDWQVILANDVAAALAKEFPQKYLGLLAYNQHAAPPAVRLHPRVSVTVATAFNTSGLSFDAQLARWRAQMDYPAIGVYDYWNNVCWHQGRIGARGGRLAYMADTLPRWYAQGVRLVTTETLNGWSQNGLAYYVANRLAFDVRTDVDAVVADYVAHCFPRSTAVMTDFYRRLNGEEPLRVSADHRGRLFRDLQRALALETDPRAIARLDDLALYLAYYDRYCRYSAGLYDPAELMGFIWKAWHSHPEPHALNFEADWLWQYLPEFAYPNIKRPAGWNDDPGKSPWKPGGVFTHDDIVRMVDEGVAGNPVVAALDRRPAYSRKLAPAGSAVRAPMEIGFRRGPLLWLYAQKGGRLPAITMAGGTAWTLYDAAGTKALETGAAPDDRRAHRVAFHAAAPGLYQLRVACPPPPYDPALPAGPLDWAPGSPVVMDAAAAGNCWPGSNRWVFFYVPKGLAQVILYFDSDQNQEIMDASGRILHAADGQPHLAGYAVVPVPPGQDGTIWRLRGNYVSGAELINVPPYTALSPDELLAPAECLARQ